MGSNHESASKPTGTSYGQHLTPIHDRGEFQYASAEENCSKVFANKAPRRIRFFIGKMQL